jgi:hypothetical protein
MNLGCTFTTLEPPASARQLIDAYLEGVGYKPVGYQPASGYERGSSPGSMIGFTIKGWLVTATLQPGFLNNCRSRRSF